MKDFPTRAMILAAGEGRRLRPLTEQVPKCMVPLGGRPLLEYTIERLRGFSVCDLIINVSYLPEAVQSYFGDGRQWGVRIAYSVEPKPLGTAGGVKKAAWFFDGPFFVWYGDNLSTCDLARLYRFHKAKGGLATIALHRRRDPTRSGIVGLDPHQRMVRFLEKPAKEKIFSRWVNSGIFVLEPRVLDLIPEEGAPDFGRDIFPALVAEGRPIYGYPFSARERLWWIDTPKDLRRLEKQAGRVQTLIQQAAGMSLCNRVA